MSTIIKVELYEGCAYALDEWGNIWQLSGSNEPNLAELRLVTRLDRISRDGLMNPQLARFAR
jgi:hypothetical protein